MRKWRWWQRKPWLFCDVCGRRFRSDIGFDIHCNFVRCGVER